MKKRVFTNGVFDIIHCGHIQLFKECRRLFPVEDYDIVVGLNSDESVKRLKGAGRPYMNQHERKEILSAIKYIDEVYIFDEDTPIRLMEILKPDFIVKGGDYAERRIVGSEKYPVVIIPQVFESPQRKYSSSSVFEKLSKNG